MKFQRYITGILLAGGLTFSACEGMLDYKPVTETVADDAINTVEDLEDFQLSAYFQLTELYKGSVQSANFLISDNVDGRNLKSGDYARILSRNTNFFTGASTGIYSNAYKAIARANQVMDYFEPLGLTEEEAAGYEAQSRFIRAIAHFQAVMSFAHPYGYMEDNSQLGVPLRLEFSTEFANRNTVNEVYAQVIEDLTYAEQNLPTENPGLATSWSAKAMLAKVYLQMGDYDKAFEKANDIIENGPFVLDEDFRDKFSDYPTAGTTENIFYLVSNPNRFFGGDLRGNFRANDDQNATLRVSREVYELMEDEDQRKSLYKVMFEGEPNEYIATDKFEADYFDMPLTHLTEMHYIRAEAAVLKSTQNLEIAAADLETLLQRAYNDDAYSLPSMGQAMLLEEVRKNKRIEMLGEGVRINDLKRIGAFENSDLEIRNAKWNCPGMIFQFPANEFKPGFEGNPEGGC